MAAPDTGKNGHVAIAEAAINPDEVFTLDDFVVGGQPKTVIMDAIEFKRPNGVVPKFEVRGMTAGEQDTIARAQNQLLHIDDRTVETQQREEQIRALALSWCVRDPITHKEIFSPKHIFDIQGKAGSWVTRTYSVILQLSQTTQEEINQIVGIFTRTPAGNSSTD